MDWRESRERAAYWLLVLAHKAASEPKCFCLIRGLAPGGSSSSSGLHLADENRKPNNQPAEGEGGLFVPSRGQSGRMISAAASGARAKARRLCEPIGARLLAAPKRPLASAALVACDPLPVSPVGRLAGRPPTVRPRASLELS